MSLHINNNRLQNSFSLFIFFVAHVIRIPFDPNPHHDGLMYTAAIASSTGLFPHRDFFSQYGPLTPFIHGLWFLISPNTLLSLRFFNALLLSATSLLLFHVLRNRVGSRISFLITLIWSISSPEILPAGLPWPSVVSTLILLAAIYIVDIFKIHPSKSVVFLVGILTALALFARIHNLIIPVLFTILCIQTKRYRLLAQFLLGYLSCITIVLGILYVNSGFLPFIQQSIVWPVLGHAGTTYGAKAMLVNALLLLQFPFFAFILWFTSRLPWKNSLFAITILTTCLLAAYLYSRSIPEIPVSERSFTKVNYLSAFVAQQSLQMMIYGLIAVCMVLQFKAISKRLCYSQSSILISSISVGAIFQLYPSPDTYHVWWVTPVLLAGLPTSSSLTFGRFTKPKILIAILIVNFFHVSEVISFDRARYQSSILAGMYGNEQEVDQALIAIENLLPVRSAHFECVDGLFASNTMGYLANDVLYVNWPKNVENPRKGYAKFIVGCGSPQALVKKNQIVVWSNAIITIRKVRQD